MRNLAEPKVLGRAALAAFLTALLCLPRLTSAPGRGPLWLLWPLLVWCAFMLWAFVFAWQPDYVRRPIFYSSFRPQLWLVASLYGLAWAILHHFVFDPPLRRVAPASFPADVNGRLAIALFTLALAPLFSCFAPFAFFARIIRRLDVAAFLTVLFDIFILYSQLSILAALPPFWITVGMLVACVVSGSLTLYFYYQGGALLVWWVLLLVQSRHFFDLTTPP